MACVLCRWCTALWQLSSLCSWCPLFIMTTMSQWVWGSLPLFLLLCLQALEVYLFMCLSDSSQLPITAICIMAIQLKVYGLLEEEVLQQLGPAVNNWKKVLLHFFKILQYSVARVRTVPSKQIAEFKFCSLLGSQGWHCCKWKLQEHAMEKRSSPQGCLSLSMGTNIWDYHCMFSLW